MQVYDGNPQNVALGTNDDSGRVKERIQRETPQFLPIFFPQTPKGEYRSQIVSGAELEKLYGEELITDRNKYTNHSTFYLRGAIRAGAAAMVSRLPYTPEDGVTDDGFATITIWATVNINPVESVRLKRDPATLEAITDVLTLSTDSTLGNIPATHYIRLSATPSKNAGMVIESELNAKFYTDGFGDKGDAISYPLFTLRAPAHGEPYNDYGIWFDAMTKDGTDHDMINAGLYPYVMGVYDKTNGRPKRQQAKFGDSRLTFTLDGVRNHPKYNYPISITDTVAAFNKYVARDNDATDTWFDDVIVHHNQIKNLMDKLIIVEQAYLTSGVDEVYNATQDISATPATQDEYRASLLNILTLRASSGVHYETLRPANMIDSDINPVITTSVGNTIYAGIGNPVYMTDGKSGVISCDAMEAGMLEKFDEYTDIDSIVINTATNKESAWVDSGFSLHVKLAAAKLLTHRRDISLITATYETPMCGDQLVKKVHQTESEALGVETLVKNVYSLYPESVEFNTATSRAAIIVGYGKDVEDSYPSFLPVTYDFMIKNCKLAGGFDGKMDRNSTYSSRGGNIIEHQKDLYPKEITHTLAKQLWSRGAIWMVPNDRKEMIYSSNQTIYTDDTSILNRYVIQIVLTTLVKLNDEAWRFFTGTDDMLNPQLKIAVEDYINRRVGKDKFLDSIKIVPNVYFSKEDLLNGFSWHLEVSVASNVGKTVMISNLKSLRREN